MKKSMRATFLMVLMFYSGTLCAGALMETAGKKLEQAREIGKFAKSIVDAKQDELNSLLQEKAALEEQEKEFAKTTKVAIEEVKNQLAELEKVIKCNGNVVDEAADVANFLMMIADNHKRKLEEDDDEEWE